MNLGLQKVIQWIAHGPQQHQTSLTSWMLAMILWWRMWAVGMLMAGSFLMGVGAYQADKGIGLLVMWVMGLLAGAWILKASPKYDVRRNY